MATTLAPEALGTLAASVALLLGLARLLGHVARRQGVPPVVGELAAGVLLGPSVLGAISPSAALAVVPAAGGVRSALDALAFLGVVLVLASTGAALDLRRATLLLRSRPWLPALSLLVPLALGLAIGALLPAPLLGPAEGPVAVLVIGVILAISALPTVARTLTDLELLHRDLGQLALGSAAIDDVVGWFLLAVTTASVSSTGPGGAGPAVLVAAAFFLGAWLVGRWLFDVVMTVSLRLTDTVAGPLTTSLVLVLATTSLAMAMGLDAVIGALVAGLLLGSSPAMRPRARAALDETASGFLGPIFFALAGASLDVRVLEPMDLLWIGLLLAAALGGKVLGALLGAGLSGLPPATGRAIGVALGARGGLGVVVAAVALSIGVLSSRGYAVVVGVAILSSLLAPLVLARLVRDLPVDDDERDRLRRRVLLEASPVGGARRVLLLTRGGAHSRVAARVCDLCLDPGATATVLVVRDPGDEELLPDGRPLADPAVAGGHVPPEEAGRSVAALLGRRRTEIRVITSRDVAAAILEEARRGYDLLVVGASGDVQGPAQLGPVLAGVLLACRVPVLLVRSRTDTEGLNFTRLLTTATGTGTARAGQDVAFSLARQAGAAADVLHVISRSDRILLASWFNNAERQPAPHHLLAEATARASLLGVAAAGHVRVGASAAEELVACADELQADTVVTATTVRPLQDRPFLGHGVEYLLEHATQNLVVLALPTEPG